MSSIHTHMSDRCHYSQRLPSLKLTPILTSSCSSSPSSFSVSSSFLPFSWEKWKSVANWQWWLLLWAAEGTRTGDNQPEELGGCSHWGQLHFFKVANKTYFYLRMPHQHRRSTTLTGRTAKVLGHYFVKYPQVRIWPTGQLAIFHEEVADYRVCKLECHDGD